MSNNSLIWKNLGTFWDRVPEKDKIEVVWDSIKESLDDLYIQSYQTDDSKSLATCPIFTTKRWIMLDLSQDNLTKVDNAGRAILEENKTSIQSNTSLDDTIFNTQRSVLHKHYKFIYDPDNGLRLNFPFPLDYTTVEIYRTGKLLQALSHYRVESQQIIFNLTGEHIIYLSVDHTPRVAEKFLRHQSLRTTSSSGLITLGNRSKAESTGFLVINEGELLNQDQFSFVDKNTINAPGFTGNFEILWCEEESINSFTERHEHRSFNVVFNQDGMHAGSVSYFRFSGAMNGVSDPLFRVFVNGELVDDYTLNNNKVTFTTPVVHGVDEAIKIHVEWINVFTKANFKHHRHFAWQATNYQKNLIESQFDDGGVFDDTNGIFDSLEESPTVPYPFIIRNQDNISIYVDGLRLYRNIDYVSNTSGIKFNVNINGKNVKLTYFDETRVFQYGFTDIRFENSRFAKSNLSLFYEENFPGQNIEADDQQISLDNATSIIFDNIELISIPVILDGIVSYKNLYKEELTIAVNDYELDDGVILSDIELPINAWCPLVYFDERTLANNFGVLVGFEEASSLRYKAILASFYRALWDGPTIRNLEWGISILMDMPFVPQASQLTNIDHNLLINKVIKTSSESFTIDDTELSEGETVYAGQSVASRNNTVGVLDGRATLSYRTIAMTSISVNASSGDILNIQEKQTFTIASTPNSDTIIVGEDPIIPIGLQLSNTIGILSVNHDSIGWYVSGFDDLSTVIPEMKFQTNAVEYNIDYVTGANRIYVDSQPTLGSTYSIYTNDAFNIYTPNGDDVFTNDGVVASIDENRAHKLYFSTGEIINLPIGIETYLKTGDVVQPYQPLALVADVIDLSNTPQWWLENKQTFKTNHHHKTTTTTRTVHPYDKNIEVLSTSGFPRNGIIFLEGTIGGYHSLERIRYHDVTDTKFLNCERGFEFVNIKQSPNAYAVGTTVSSKLTFQEESLSHLALQIYKSNTGYSDFNDIEQYFDLFGSNVLIVRINNFSIVNTKRLKDVDRFIKRVKESSVRFHLDFTVDLQDDVAVSTTQEIRVDKVYTNDTISIAEINEGRIVSEIFVTPTSAFYAGEVVNNTTTFANVVHINTNSLFISYINGTFSIGDYLNTIQITDVNNLNILLYSIS